MTLWTELWTVCTYLTLSMSWMYCCSSQPTRARSFLSSCCSTMAGTQPSKNLVTNMPALRARQATWVETEGQANTWEWCQRKMTEKHLPWLANCSWIINPVGTFHKTLYKRLQFYLVKMAVVFFMCRSGGSSVWGLLPNLMQQILLHFTHLKKGLLLKNYLTWSNYNKLWINCENEPCMCILFFNIQLKWCLDNWWTTVLCLCCLAICKY